MAERLSQLLVDARARWMIGGETAGADHPLLAGRSAAEADLRLLAVAGQYRRLCQPPRAPALTARPDLPRLALPLLPEALRPLSRRLLADKAERAPQRIAVLVAQRGHVLHPADWMPPPGADLPEVYRPLQLWQAEGTPQPAALTSDTWLDHSRADRLGRFGRLRAADPAAARALLAERLAACPSDERLSLVEALGAGLSDDDAALLEGLSKDRSDKVRKAALRLLARLGRSESEPLAAEAALMFEVATEGILRRQPVIRLNPKAKEGQLRSLSQTLPELTLQGLAAALGLGPAEFVAAWQPGKVAQPVQVALTAMIARTASGADLAAYWTRVMEQSDEAQVLLPLLFPRLSDPDREAAALWLIGQSGLAACAELVPLMGPGAPVAVSAALTARCGDLVDLLRQTADPKAEKAAAARTDTLWLATSLALLGLMVSADDAARILRTVTEAGIHPADPILDHLSFNAALRGPT